jgi:filamentous hemagglutinin
LRSNGFDVIGEELTVKAAIGYRRYDAVVRADNGELWGIEYKSGGATKTSQQNFNDMYINKIGSTEGVGLLKGELIVGNITIYLP